MHSNRKHLMMGKNKDQGVRKMVRIVINEPSSTWKGLHDLEAECTVLQRKQSVIHSTTKASMDALFSQCIADGASIEALGV